MSAQTTKRKGKGVTKREILTFGFVRENCQESVPDGVILIMVEFSKLCLESNILTQEEQEYLIEMIEATPQTERFKYNEWKILCSGKKDGIKQKVFHDTCDGKENTVCLLDVSSTGYVCGGYASIAWKGADWNEKGKDDDAFLFVIRPIEARKVCHRKKDENGKLLRPDCGILFCDLDGFNFGYNTLFWGNGEDDPELVDCADNQHYFEYESAKDIVGQLEDDEEGDSWCSLYPTFSDFEVFQLMKQ